MTAGATTTDSTGVAGDLDPDAAPDTTRGPEMPVEPPEPAGEGQDTGDTGPNREAAKYRRQLRSAEADRDGLRAQVESLQRAEVERIAAGEGLTKPSAIWSAGVKLADLVAEDGTVDSVKVLDAVGRATDTLGLAIRRPPKPDHSQGPRGGDTSAHDWSSFLKASSK